MTSLDQILCEIGCNSVIFMVKILFKRMVGESPQPGCCRLLMVVRPGARLFIILLRRAANGAPGITKRMVTVTLGCSDHLMSLLLNPGLKIDRLVL